MKRQKYEKPGSWRLNRLFATKQLNRMLRGQLCDQITMNYINAFRTGLLPVFLTVSLAACTPERVKYTPELKQQMADMKLKRITNADLVETVDQLGGKVVAVIQKELIDSLGSTTDAAQRSEQCRLQNLPRTRAISQRYGVDIRLLSGADVQNKALAPKEREVLDAYLYNAEQKLPQIANIQKINDTLYIYNAAVPTESVICRTCFGQQKTPLAVWRLAFTKREVVRRMSASAKKKRDA